MTAAEFIRNSRMSARRVALHLSFFPADAMNVLRRELPSTTFVEAFPILEELRAVKTKQELAHLKAGAAAVVDSVLATFQTARPGVTEAELADRLRLEQSQRGLVFDYALITSGVP
jgi:Xaa-Pro aminopeptidase